MRILLFLLLLFSYSQFFGQERSEVIQQGIEFISEQLQSEDLDLTNFIEQLNYYYDNPININATTGEDLDELNLLSSVQINDLLLHRKAFGKFMTIYELQSLKYWDLITIQLVLPFIRVDDRLDNLNITWKEVLKEGTYELYLRYQPTIEEKAGYASVSDSIKQVSNNYYFGNSDRYYSRFRYTYKTNISVGFTAEKDAGESFLAGHKKWF